MSDPYHLTRFVDAQAPVIADAFQEIRNGRKRSHWMWFVFPQVAGLGSSATAQRYAIGSLAEAQAFLAHPVLGPRLREATALMNRLASRSATEVLGVPDDMKFRSSMTLFAAAGPESACFNDALAHFFDGVPDPATLAQLRG